MFKEIAASDVGPVQFIRPLCPTRWLCRLPVIECAIKQYESIISSQVEVSENKTGDFAANARGLHARFNKGGTVLRLHMSEKPMPALEQLNWALQAKAANVSGEL